MKSQRPQSPGSRTVHVLLITLVAFLLGGYASRFSWDNWGWAATAIASLALAVGLFFLIRDFFRPNPDELGK
jgi:hypothetical protein